MRQAFHVPAEKERSARKPVKGPWNRFQMGKTRDANKKIGANTGRKKAARLTPEEQEYRLQKKLRALTQVGVRVLHSLRQALDARPDTCQRQLLVSGDGSYTNRTVLRQLPARTSIAAFELIVPSAQRLPAPAHSHDHYEETIYGIDAVLTLTVDGKRIDVGPGQALCIPRGAIQPVR